MRQHRWQRWPRPSLVVYLAFQPDVICVFAEVATRESVW